MSKFTLLTAFILCLLSGIHAQNSFQKSFAQPGQGGLLYRCIETPSGDFFTTGQVTDYTSFENEMLAMKITSSGSPSWIRVVSGSGSASLTGTAVTLGEAMIAVGSSFNMTSFLSEAIVLKYSATGILLWSKKITLAGGSVTAKAVETDAAGNCYILGAADVAGAFQDYLLIQLGPEGNLISATTFGTPQSDYPLALHRTEAGDFLVAGWQNSGSGENVHVLKISSSYSLLWNKLISGPVKYFSYDIGETQTGQAVFAGRYDDGTTSYDILLAMLDGATGNQVWARQLSAASGPGTYAYGLTIGEEDIIALTGIVEGTDQGTFLVETTATGSLVASTVTITTGSPSHGYGITALSTGGYLVCGPMSGSTGEIVHVVSTDGSGSFPCNSSPFDLTEVSLTLPMQTLTMTTAASGVSVETVTLSETSYNALGTVCLGTGSNEPVSLPVVLSPNPSDGSFTITLPETMDRVDLSILTASGMIVYKESFSSISRTITLHTGLPAGLYLLKISGEKEFIATKLIIGRH